MSRQHGVSILIVCCLLVAGAPAQRAAAQAPLCDEATPLTLVGMDTASGRALLSLPAAAGDGRALLELTAEGAAALYYPPPAGDGRYAGSVGGGPVVTLERCGAACVAPQRWHQGAWEKLGKALAVPATANLFTAYDRGGHPWLISHEAGDGDWLVASAWVFTGELWQPRGRQYVLAPGILGVAAAPWAADAMVTGSGVFSLSEPPRQWITGLPAPAPADGGQLWALSAGSAVYLGGGGAVYVSTDGGAGWSRSRWKPWGIERRDVWTFGVDFGYDLPLGTLGEPLPVVWFDRRGHVEPKVILSELDLSGRWQLRAELPTRVELGAGRTLEWVHFLHTAGGSWVMMTDCLADASGSGIVRRLHTPAGLTAPQRLPVRPAGRGR